MRGLVLKNHYESTASVAYLVRKEVPGIEIFGGIALNLTVGGINAVAVERMTMVKGGYGRVVWMPTYDAENHVRDSKENRPFISIAKNGELLPAVKEVIGVVARHNLTLETGHSSAEECLMLIREARKQGVQHIVVTHALTVPVRMSIDQMKEAAALGAYLELVYGRMNLAQYVAAIRQVGPEHIILSTDLGQPNNPLHPDGLVAYFGALKKEGFSDADIAVMSKTNPARALGLP
jgi:microsomal dipeptidase-like Zn-dependent dipeptidase